MNALADRVHRTLYFCYARPEGFSGQKAATELVRDGLAARGWHCMELPQPVLDRSAGWRGLFRYAWQVLAVWLRSSRLLFARGSRLWVGLGQTRASLLRDSLPLLFGRLGLGRDQVVISLNGSRFMTWSSGSLEARAFRFLLGHAGMVTVVGERQRERLLGLGTPAARAVVIVNSCTLAPLSPSALELKFAVAHAPGAPVRCLHLSSLIDTKGFPEFLLALNRLAALAGPPVEAVLCGRLVASEFAARFRTEQKATAWIEEQLGEINRSQRVAVRWIKGAAGTEKEELFRTADIFLLPTQYAVEAQPLVLLEAMASGCAIITTTIAEIPTILDAETARFIPEVTETAVAGALQALVECAGTRARLARAAHARYCERYQPASHLDAWEAVLLSAPVRCG